MPDKEFNLLNKLITSLGYNINEIEDIFDYEEFCEHIIQEQKELKEYAQRQENQKETYYKELLKKTEECAELKKYIQEREV